MTQQKTTLGRENGCHYSFKLMLLRRGERPVRAHTGSAKFALRALAARRMLRVVKIRCCCAAVIPVIQTVFIRTETAKLGIAILLPIEFALCNVGFHSD